jgi:hypothetical protein
MRTAALLAACLGGAAVAAQAQGTPGTQIGYVSISAWHSFANWAYSETREPSDILPGSQTGSLSTRHEASFWHVGLGQTMDMVAAASFEGTAAIGALHASASTTAEGFRNAGASITTAGTVSFWDYVTVSGTPGQWVNISWRTDLHGVRACTGDSDLAPYAMAQLTYVFNNLTQLGVGSLRGDASLASCGDNTRSDSGVMSLQVGDRVRISADLMAWAMNGDAMDAGNTARLYFDVLTPGASLVSQSGHDYSVSAVPEPASLALWALGLVGLIGYRRLRE